MIEIIKPKADEVKHEIVCPNCDSLLRYTDEDLEMARNEQGFECPNCEDWICVKKYPTFEFPTSFYHFGKNAFKVNDEQTQKWIDQCVNYVKQSNEPYDFTSTGSGDTLVIAFKCADGITCYVAKDYYEASKE